MMPELIEIRTTTKNGCFMVYKDTEELGLFDVEDIEALDDDTLKALAITAAHEIMNRGI